MARFLSKSLWILLLVVSITSSCTIRKGIQAGLNIPVTRQLNPSKTFEVRTLLCFQPEVETIETNILPVKYEYTPALKTLIHDFIHIQTNTPKCISESAGSKITPQIPLFILYKQIKTHLYL